MTKIIDLRNRPAFLHDFFGATPGSPGYATAKWLNQRLGSIDVEHFKRSLTLPDYLQQLDEAGLHQAVLVGRETPDIVIDNDWLAELVSASPKLLGIAGIDAQKRNHQETQQEIDRLIGQGFKGINLEPGFGQPPLQADDPKLYPIYEACIHYDVPVCLMSGPTTPDPDFAHPNPVARLARQYPKLKIICFHGYYPYVNEIIGIAFRYSNVYLVPDMYIFQPGSQLYVQAANQFLEEQLLFASSYPFRALKQSIDEFIKLGFKDSILDKLLYQNAQSLLKL